MLFSIDKKLSPTAYRLYNVLVAMANIHTHSVTAYVSTLAKKLNRSARTVRRHLHTLEELGIIGRIMRQSTSNPKMNLASDFLVFGRTAPCYQDSELEIFEKSTNMPELSAPDDKNGSEIKKELFKKDKNLTLIRNNQENQDDIENDKIEDETDIEIRKTYAWKTKLIKEIQSQQETENSSKNQQSFSGLENIPEILKPTARYLMFCTGRTNISPHEAEILKELEKIHTPTRINREIDRAVKRFKKRNKNLLQLTFNYIGAALKNQKSFTREKTNISTPNKTQPQSIQPQNLSMPIEEAEKIIANFKTSQNEKELISPELMRRFNAINEILANETELTNESYLSILFPDIDTEKIIEKSTQREIKDISSSKNLDLACATCSNPEHCSLPINCKIGRSRPILSLRGQEKIFIGYGGKIICRFKTDTTQNTEYQQRIRKSLLTPEQAQQNFNNYKTENFPPEIIVAKAQAILAAQNQRSIIIAGQAGTGKTHLAISIAIEFIRKGQQAIFVNSTELLEKLVQSQMAYNTDFLEYKQKFMSADCLILDDLGKEKMTHKRLEQLYAIIDFRYRHKTPTIVTTNAFTIEDLKDPWNEDWNKNYIEPIISRILGNGSWVTITEAEDYRTTHSTPLIKQN